jgi:predicted aspartyl protease
MIRFKYTRQFNPPAPFVYVSLRCPVTGAAVHDLPAQVDTAADRTVIPGSLVEHLGLEYVDTINVAGLGAGILAVLAYRVELTIRALSPHQVVVVAQDEEPYVLLGRDVLNRYRRLFDGPSLALEIG